MGWSAPLNGVGMLAGLFWAGQMFREGGSPWIGLGASALFFVALALPFFGLWRSLAEEFEDRERDQVDALRRARGDGPKVEVFAPEAPGPKRCRKAPRRPGRAMALVLSALALGLLVWDGLNYVGRTAEKDAPSPVISNY